MPAVVSSETDKRIQELVAELRRIVPADLPTQMVVAEGVVATIVAEMVAAHGLDPDYLVRLAQGQIQEMVDTSLAFHSLN